MGRVVLKGEKGGELGFGLGLGYLQRNQTIAFVGLCLVLLARCNFLVLVALLERGFCCVLSV